MNAGRRNGEQFFALYNFNACRQAKRVILEDRSRRKQKDNEPQCDDQLRFARVGDPRANSEHDVL